MIPVHPVTASCEGPAECACEAFVAANLISAACFYVQGKEIMTKVVAALPTTEADAVTAAAAVRLIESQDVGTGAARFHLVYAIRDHLVASRRTPGGRYKLWATTEGNAEARNRWGLTVAEETP
jgi:hypothetical protein